jgi:hypothetical protein
VKRTPLLRAALSAVWLPFACSPDVVAQDTATSSGSASGTGIGTDAGIVPAPEPDPPAPGTRAQLATFDRQHVVIQAGVGDWGTAGPNGGYAAWPVHGEQGTLTIPPPDQSPANLDLDLTHIADLVLRLHHRAGTITPVGQCTFTPSCG